MVRRRALIPGHPHPDLERRLDSAGLLIEARRYAQARSLLDPENARSHLAWEGRFVPRNWRDVRSSRAKIVVSSVVVYLFLRLLWAIAGGILG